MGKGKVEEAGTPVSPVDRPAEEEPGRAPAAAARGGETLAASLRALEPGLSWRQARELCQAGRVLLDGVVEREPATRLRAGSRVELGSGGDGGRREEDLVVHADRDLVVVRKPAGVLTVPFERGDRDTLLALARVAVRRLGLAGGPTLRAVQRLDRDTSGLVVFARTVPAQRALQAQLAAHTIHRRYLAIVHGLARPARYDTWLVADRGDGLKGSLGTGRRRAASARPSRAVGPAGPAGAAEPQAGARAVTHVAVVERLGSATLVSCRLETGRQHQIRIHLAEAGHPLVGETIYVRDFRGPLLPAPRPMLHACELGFLHPRDGRPLLFELPPPVDFQEVLGRLRGQR